jgi:hypothetical protein
MQTHYAPLPMAVTIVFIPDDKRLSGEDTIVTPIFLGSQKGPDVTRQVKIVKLC